MRHETVYPFKVWDQQAGDFKTSSRWATREAIGKIDGAEILEETAIEIDAAAIGQEVEGMTERNYDPS